MISPSNPHARDVRDSGGMQSPHVVSIMPPPPVVTYPNGSTRPWNDWYADDCRVVVAVCMDRTLKRIDFAVIGALVTDYKFTPFCMGEDFVANMSASLANWGPLAAPNKIALSLKRLARKGYLSPLPEHVFRHGIDTKQTSKKLRAKVFARDGHACLHCGVTFALQLDHITPRSQGGETCEENLQTLCQPCNRRKGIS